MHTQIGYYKNVITPDNGADSQLRFQIQAMSPKQARLKILMLQAVKYRARFAACKLPSGLLV
jgi:hypothetical protein